jgi:hypothetical protein
MKELKEILSECMREAGSIEDLAERLVDRGVQIVPEGAIILTRAEVEALGEYEKMLKGVNDEQR